MPARNCIPDKWLVDGDKVHLGNEELDVIFTPGHTPGHIVFFSASSKLALVGDVIFNGSIGRTDLPRGNHQDLIDSISQKLWKLGSDVEFVCGHGPNSTFGQERESNPFVSDAALS
jgi:glyoxylase-like metal-dependent hydrolase (beta-lactamase superfamily II)